MDKYDTSKLTEFPRFEGEACQSSVTTFLNKLWKFPLFSPGEASDSLDNKSVHDEKDNSKLNDGRTEEYDELKTETVTYVGDLEGRSLPNVLKRIKSLVALGSGGGTKYADTELAQYWMPDDISRECYECAARFGTLRRRHHCRVCGQIFCSRCCSQRVPGQIFGCAGGLRVCNYCCNVVLSYLQENDATADISPDLRTLQENLQTKFPDNRVQSIYKGRDFMFEREQEASDSRATAKESLTDVYRQLFHALPTQQHRYRLVRYNAVWRGCDVQQWVMDNTSYKTRAQANQFCQNMVCGGLVERVTEPPQFADYALYRPSRLPCEVVEAEQPPAEECSRLVESVSSYCLDLNLGTSSARLTKALKKEPITPQPCDDQPALEQNACDSGRNLCRAISQSGDEHLGLLMRQWLAREGLSPAWLPVLYPLCVRAAELVCIDMMSKEMDVRNYVHVKKVPGGAMSDSCVVQGVVMTKNVAHRRMPKHISNPTVLLLDCSIAYQRVEGKLTSLEPMLMQEQEYLSRCVARISALRPRVVLVRGGVASAVQDALRAAGVALAVRVGARTLGRVARCARADAVSSVDARIAAPRLGSVDRFYVTTYSSKTLMFLEGCAEPNLGCCILLRGASVQELTRVKKLVKFMTLACYNWKLEKSFLADIEATLPEPDSFVEEEDKNTAPSEEASKVIDTGCKTSVTNDLSDKVFVSKPISNDINKETNSNVTNELKSIEKVDGESSDNEGDKCSALRNDIKEGGESQLKPKSFTRKTDSDKNLSCGVPIRDFSDPLHSNMSLDDEVFLPLEEAKLKADTQNERWCTDDVVLSMSPNIVIPAPTRPLRAPPQAAPHTPRPARRTSARPPPSPAHMKEAHVFIKQPITTTSDDTAFRASLASFRATGCRIKIDDHKSECPKYNPSVVKRSEESEEESGKSSVGPAALDPLSPENHQQLSVLIYSYCSKSPNVPDFCVNPWIVTMEMYGHHDISLGAFLEKYCFNGDLKCTSPTCHVPINQHVRRFVHGDVCITITCNTVGHSNVDKDKVNEEQSRQVTFWSLCELCGSSSRGSLVSRRALSLSLCAYVRARLHAPRYRRQCGHALHAHVHAFVSRLTTARFRYNKISTYDIQMPPDVISVNYDTKQMRDALITHLNELMLKGHETFSDVSEADAEKDYAMFKQHMEQIHLALTSPHMHAHATRAAVVRSLWGVYDTIIAGEKMLRDAQEQWASPAAKTKTQTDNSADEKELEESAELGGSEITDGVKENEREHTGADEDEEKGDKKTVKQILAQLLSNNHHSNQASIIISSGLVPVVVAAGEIGSVIAATLASVTYQRSLVQHMQSVQNDLEEGEASGGKEKADADKTKAKSTEHIEVLLKEGLICRVYYASQFRRLRHMLTAPLDEPAEQRCCDEARHVDGKSLCDIEEGFIRSLAHCVPWAARGGKSGSTFCKTKDDRYVLKEMTKPEWQQFLEFAPHYFNYVTECRQKKLPSLLARILGVFSVGGAGSGVLVLEHVWYARDTSLRFDLKGTSRPRVLAPVPAAPVQVLLDENLLRLRWETQLYVPSSTCAQLWRCVERDTQFLAAHHVMDYSLLLGVADQHLVLGIIDYIRTFTWDKKLEHLVKKNLGSGQPTVVSPEQYKSRFCAAARKYFMQCPTHWDHLYGEET